MAEWKPVPRPTLVEVEWADSMHISGWGLLEDRIKMVAAEAELDHVSVGYLIKKTPRSVVLVQSIGRVPNVDAVMQIPRKAVKSITVLKARVK